MKGKDFEKSRVFEKMMEGFGNSITADRFSSVLTNIDEAFDSNNTYGT